MKALLASVLIAAAPAWVLAQSPAKPAGKPAAVKKKPAAPVKAASDEPDPSIQLSDADLETAKKVHVGDIACELGATVSVKPHSRHGFFRVSVRNNHFVMHPVHSRTGAIRLEDPARGAMWLQLGNKSMLMSQKMGQRLADECQSADQAAFAETLKTNPLPNLLEPGSAPAAPAAAAAAPPQPEPTAPAPVVGTK
jgi:hypothetical protein